MTLPPYKDFCEWISPHFNSVPGLSAKRRKELFRDLYKLAGAKLKKEEERLAIIEHAKRYVRPRLTLYKRAEKAIKNARRYIEKAETIYSQPPKPIEPPPWVALLGEAKAKLDEASRKLQTTKGFLVSDIDSSLGKKEDQDYLDRLLDEQLEALEAGGKQEEKWLENYELVFMDDYDLDHIRSRAVDHWFISEADSLLKSHVGARTLRQKLIAALFLDVFQETVRPSKIKTVLDRQKKARR